MLEIYKKMDFWWIANVEVPSNPDLENTEVEPENTFSLKYYFTKAIFDIVILDDENSYKELLKRLKHNFK